MNDPFLLKTRRDKALLERSLEVATLYKREETGWIHFFFESKKKEEEYLAIPLFMNMAHVAALFSAKEVHKIQEGQERLLSLLAFQREENPLKGFFPKYIHQFPGASSSFIHSLLMVSALTLIQKEHSECLSSLLKTEVEKSLIVFEEGMEIPQNLSPATSFLAESFLAQKGKKTFKERPLVVRGSYDCFLYSLALSLLDQNVKEGVIDRYLLELSSYYHPLLGEYIGPLSDERLFYGEYAPYPTLFFQKGEERALLPHEIYLSLFSSSLIEKKIPFTPFKRDIEVSHLTWQQVVESDYSIECVSSYAPSSLLTKRGFHLCRLLFSKASLVCQETKMPFKGEIVEGGMDLFFTFESQQEGRGDKEVLLFLTKEGSAFLGSGGKKGSLFSLGDTLEFLVEEMKLEVTFSKVAGEGTFSVHLFLQNRLNFSSYDMTEAKDWALSVRQLSLEGRIKASIRLLPL